MAAARSMYLWWKALRLPWRKDVLAGTDLDGNLYFERLVRGAYRSRRRVLYRKNITVGEYSDKIIPVQWQAWMRHTRIQPPTVAELVLDMRRQERVAESARRLALRDARVAACSTKNTSVPSREQQQFQKLAPGEGFSPEGWHPSSRASDNQDDSRIQRQGS
ncbi:hypothetical protein COEREDRAFT_86721 [Coemansia reversa NRRL 1564]|uniref:Uncharacterized protein n=1 Tax=Coemansia reversa (strain ATCC 12441 / NRRL 1564) TaxID=763665 RepID=A0A2G5BCA6_COERN|nr:hypothetical protein COEREDRAFT_86721 [Coemansia reversa NRRL 1564]|eukprot:PIA16631.1 hypothetical protein COEREDRAFT_86721 [Coemansia reversa NRRL 1564]